MAEMCPRCVRDVGEMWPRCVRDVSEVCPRCGRDVAEMRPRPRLALEVSEDRAADEEGHLRLDIVRGAELADSGQRLLISK